MANRQTIVGAFVLGGIALGVAAFVLFGNFHPFSTSQRAVVIFQGSASGLAVGAPVTFRGVRVGAVSGISIEFDQQAYAAFIPVTLELQPDQVRLAHSSEPLQLTELIQHGLRAELNIQSFVTGQSQIDLDFDAASPAVFHPGFTDLPEIPARQSAIQKAQQTLSQLPLKELADNANASVESIRQLAERLDTDLPTLIESLKATSDRSKATLDAATQAIGDLQQRLAVTLGDIDKLVEVGARQIDARGADLHALLANSDKTVTEVRQSLADLHEIVSTRSVDRANLDSVLRDLAAAAGALRGFASDVERNPQLLLSGRKP
ncbi:MAG TPA: MlaD family protein [Aliidongia sp.]|nr:MlaD family protein [Aliidongia sp.]